MTGRGGPLRTPRCPWPDFLVDWGLGPTVVVSGSRIRVTKRSGKLQTKQEEPLAAPHKQARGGDRGPRRAQPPKQGGREGKRERADVTPSPPTGTRRQRCPRRGGCRARRHLAADRCCRRLGARHRLTRAVATRRRACRGYETARHPTARRQAVAPPRERTSATLPHKTRLTVSTAARATGWRARRRRCLAVGAPLKRFSRKYAHEALSSCA